MAKIHSRPYYAQFSILPVYSYRDVPVHVSCNEMKKKGTVQRQLVVNREYRSRAKVEAPEGDWSFYENRHGKCRERCESWLCLVRVSWEQCSRDPGDFPQRGAFSTRRLTFYCRKFVPEGPIDDNLEQGFRRTSMKPMPLSRPCLA